MKLSLNLVRRRTHPQLVSNSRCHSSHRKLAAPIEWEWSRVALLCESLYVWLKHKPKKIYFKNVLGLNKETAFLLCVYSLFDTTVPIKKDLRLDLTFGLYLITKPLKT